MESERKEGSRRPTQTSDRSATFSKRRKPPGSFFSGRLWLSGILHHKTFFKILKFRLAFWKKRWYS